MYRVIRALMIRGSVTVLDSSTASSCFRFFQAACASASVAYRPSLSVIPARVLVIRAVYGLDEFACLAVFITPSEHSPRMAPASHIKRFMCLGKKTQVSAEYSLLPGTRRSLSRWLPCQSCVSIHFLKFIKECQSECTEQPL